MNEDDWQEIEMGSEDVWDRKEPITGKLISVREKVGPNESMLYTLKTAEGNVDVWGSTVLDNKFRQVKVGTVVKIEPLGATKSPKTSRVYQDFRMSFKASTVPEGDDPIDLKDIPF